MPTKKPRVQALNIFLLKEGAESPEASIKGIAGLTKHAVKLHDHLLGTLYVKPSSQRLPSWLSFFHGATEQQLEGLFNSSTSAVLLLATNGRTFVLAFGYGRALLHGASFEDDFGLKVTLNAVDPSKIYSVDRDTLDTISRHSQIQASQAAPIDEFGLDVEQDLLRAVTGTPRDPALGTTLTGKDALRVNARITLGELEALLARCLAEYTKNDYKERFAWVDNIHAIKDPDLRSKLDTALVDKIRAGEIERIWLAPPERIEWDRVAGFAYSAKSAEDVRPDLHLSDFLATLHDVNKLDVDLLRHRRVRAISHESDLIEYEWATYQCLYAEVERGQQQYLLTNGKWYRVQQAFLNQVNQDIGNIAEVDLHFPTYIQGQDPSETQYNQRVAAASNGSLALMDGQFVPIVGRDKVEFCDLYTQDQRIIHVKRYGASKAFSHLFAQGLVSGTLFFRDQQFRHVLNQKLPASHQLADALARPDLAQFTVVFAVVSGSTKPLVLPFFSKVNLRHTHRELTELGYHVAISKIPAQKQT